MSGGRSEFEMLFQLQAQLGGAFNSTFAKAQQQIASMQKQVQSLSKTQSNISAYQKQQTALESTRQKLATLQQQYDNIQQEIEETEGFSSSLENKLLSKQQQIDKTTASIEKQTQSLNRLENELTEAGVDTSNLANESTRLTTELNDLKQKQEEVAESASKIGTSGTQAIMAYQESIVASGIQEALQKLWEQTQACADASIEFESAITGVYKTVDGTDQQLAAISDEIKELSTNIPATTDEIAAVAEAAGQLGIATEDVMTFTEVMINLGESTNLLAEDAASSLAKFTNITGTVASDYSRLGSVVVDLGNNFATTEADIVAMATRLASSGKLAGLNEAEIMALAAAMSSVGIEAEAGGTAMTQTLSAIEEAVSVGGESLQSFARIAGMSADEFASAWETSPITAIQAFISGIGQLDQQGESAVLVLDELGLSGIRQSNMLKSLGLAAGTLSNAVSTANTAWDENVALTEEASKRYATTASQQTMMYNAFNNLRIAVGDNYTPALRELYGTTTDVVSGMTDFVEAHPALVKAVTAGVAVIAAATAGITAYVAIVKIAQAATALFSGVIGAAALGPIAAGVAGVAALTAVIVGVASAEETEADAVRKMTEASREDYYQLQQLKAEYEQACDVYGETSSEAVYLAWQIDELSTSFESNKQTLSDYVDACQAANDGLTSMLDANRNAFNEIGNNEGSTAALVNRLKELATETDHTVAAEEEMKAIIAELNERFPQLVFSYEDVAGGVSTYTAAIESAAQAQADLQKYEQARQGVTDAAIAMASAEEEVAKATDMQTAAKQRLAAAQKAYNDYLKYASAGDTSGMASLGALFSNEYKELQAAQEAYNAYTTQVESAQGILDQATADHEMYTEALTEYANVTGDASSSTSAFSDIISSTMSKVQALSEAYTEAYNAAYESVAGQYAIWDEAAQVVATGSDTITTALNSQTTYWQNYNSNLQSLSDRTGDIEGLSDMLSTFVDGSAESVNAVAGMASATDEELAEMVAAWQGLQAEHDLVAQSIAELKTNFTAEMDALVAAVAQDISNMNMSTQAEQAARATISAYIKVAEDMLPDVEEAYKNLANAAAEALGAPQGSGGKSDGYATGTRSAEPGFHYVGENGPELIFFNGGEQVLTAHETATWQNRMQAAAAEVATTNTTVVETDTGYSIPRSTIQVSFQINGNVTPETVEMLDLYSEEFAERVRTVVEEANADAVRRKY